MTGRRRLVLWAPVAVLLAFEAFLSSRTPAELPRLPGVPGGDKTAHAAYYALIGAATFRAARRAEGTSRGRAIVAGIGVAVGYGVLDELHQLVTPGRESDAADVLADLAGGTAGALVGAAWDRLPRKVAGGQGFEPR